jgi:hypothetical protein
MEFKILDDIPKWNSKYWMTFPMEFKILDDIPNGIQNIG